MAGQKRQRNDDSDSEEEAPDEVRLYEDGFKDRYYESKFGVLPTDVEFHHLVAKEYTIGLCWVLCYYYQVIMMLILVTKLLSNLIYYSKVIPSFSYIQSMHDE